MNDETKSGIDIQSDSMAASQPRIEAVNLTKRYEDGTLALDNVSFGINPGSIFAMLGGNGAGKTTTINLFLNFIEPTSGEALVDGIVTHKEPLKAKERIAYVSENVMLYPNFTAIQNLDFFARLGGKHDYSKDDYRDVLLRVGLEEVAHGRRLKGYSKGMRQKCGIAIAILKDAPAILLDEPTSGLDPHAGLEFIQLLKDLRGEGKAILMSTHDIFRAKDVSDTIGIMNEGVLVMERSAAELEGENLEQLYVQYMAGYEGSELASVPESVPDSEQRVETND
ncbi:MAG: ABC transporter ATP-binding protein [Pseudomonadales bacterium]|jgi:ABC-2 type transport system ATP-binding protein|nr:ABC transporter ATP-binding protein [Pseudomonadales bacterium]MDP7596891.1 ABC transporter ATP-binding protein [Pseudomonadales bacterium]HJN51716.1 ABC transporter ATP-binding protein [Pseudomonadales bacterium]|tara:strand:+ start:602 stop:1444 length:843 start_codon:yes stop_codon:yes gene_type:complete